MNSRHLVSMLQTGYTTVIVRFLSGGQAHYTYKTREEFNELDYAVVNVSGELKCVQVLEVHDEPQIDINLTRDYKWIVCKISTAQYEAELAAEAEFTKKMFKIERSAQRKQLSNKIKEFMDESSSEDFENALKSLNSEIKPAEITDASDNEEGF